MSNVLLVHGAWHGGWAWETLIPLLEKAGLSASTVDLPSAGAGGDLSADADLVRAAVTELARPVVVVGHSYGGQVISEATLGLVNVSHLVYVCAFMLDVGESLQSTLSQTPPWFDVDAAAGVIRVKSPEQVFYGDVDPTVAAACVARLGTQTLSSFGQPLSGAGWREHPSTYLRCTEDQAIPFVAQEAMSARAGTTHTLQSSHSPFLSQPEAVADIIVRVC